MADVGEFGIVIELKNGEQVARQLNAVAASGDKAEASTKRLSQAQSELLARSEKLATTAYGIDVANQRAVKTYLAEVAQVRALSREMQVYNEVQAVTAHAVQDVGALTARTTAEMKTLQRELNGAGGGLATLTNAGGRAGTGLNSLRSSVTSFAASLLGTAPGVAQFTGMLGAMTLGSGAMIGAVAAIALGVESWKAWHEEANKAKDEQDKLTSSLMKWYETSKQGADGALPKEIAAMTEKIKELRKELDGLASNSFFTRAGATASIVGAGGSRVSSWIRVLTSTLGFGEGDALAQLLKEVNSGTAAVAKQIDDGGKAIAAGTKKSAADIEKAAVEARGKIIQNETALFRAGLADPQLIATMQRQIAEYSRMAAQFAASGDVAHAIEYAKAAQELKDALKPLNDELERNWEAVKANALGLMRQEAQEIVAKTTAVEAQTKAITDNVVAMQKQLAGRFKQQSATARQQAGPDKDAVAAQKYVDDIQAIWREGAGRVAADFVRSMSRGFEEVYSLAVKLMKRMEEEFKRLEIEPGGFKYDALKFGAAAIGGGLAGYGIGQQTGSSAGGLLGGAASGALAGSAFGPWGAAIGGLAGAAGGLLGASNNQKDAAEQLRQAGYALQIQAGAFIAASRGGNAVVDALGQNDAAVAALLKAGGFQPSEGRTAKPKATGVDIEAAGARNAQRIADDFWKGIATSLNALEGPQGVYRNQLAEIETQYRDNMIAAKALNATQSQLADIEALRTSRLNALAVATARATEDLQLRIANARGGPAADRAAFDAAQRREREDAAGMSPSDRALLDIAQGLERINFNRDQQVAAVQAASDREQAAFDAQTKVAQDALAVAQDQLRAQEQAVAATQRVVDSLTQFAASLKLNTGLTTLSPIQQAAEAKAQYEATLAKAWAGDKDAAGGLPAAAQAFLTASRNVNASGPAYVADFLKVQGQIADVTERYGAQLTVEQQILQQLQSQAGTLSAQLQAVIDAKAAAAANTAAQIAAINASAAALGDRFRDAIDNWHPEGIGNGGGGGIFAPSYIPVVATAPTAAQADVTNDRLQETVDGLAALVNLQAAGFERLSQDNATLRSEVTALRSVMQDGNDADATRRVYAQ